MRISEGATGAWWFRWSLAFVFLVAMWGLPILAPRDHNYQDTYYEPEQSAERISTPISTDERLADYTEALAWWTAFLAIVAAAELGYLVRQERWMKESVAAAKLAADAAKDAARAASAQVELAREEFNATHRPEIIVHSAIEATAVMRGNGKAIAASFTYFNKGNVPAQNVAICAVIVPMRFRHELQERIVAPLLRQQPSGPIAAGRPHTFEVRSEIAFERADYGTQDASGAHANPEATVYCLGTISYDDSAGVTRQTGFCWRWDPPPRKWVRVTGNSYDYAY